MWFQDTIILLSYSGKKKEVWWEGATRTCWTSCPATVISWDPVLHMNNNEDLHQYQWEGNIEDCWVECCFGYESALASNQPRGISGARVKPNQPGFIVVKGSSHQLESLRCIKLGFHVDITSYSCERTRPSVGTKSATMKVVDTPPTLVVHWATPALCHRQLSFTMIGCWNVDQGKPLTFIFWYDHALRLKSRSSSL